jgi:hypothetical protein
MRNISFMLTPDQILDRSKTVTRRLGWKTLKPGTLVRAVRKGMGLKKGEKVEQLAIIRIVDVRRESLLKLADTTYGWNEVAREGFAAHPQFGSPETFLDMFCDTHECEPYIDVTRIEFEYV